MITKRMKSTIQIKSKMSCLRLRNAGLIMRN